MPEDLFGDALRNWMENQALARRERQNSAQQFQQQLALRQAPPSQYEQQLLDIQRQQMQNHEDNARGEAISRGLIKTSSNPDDLLPKEVKPSGSALTPEGQTQATPAVGPSNPSVGQGSPGLGGTPNPTPYNLLLGDQPYNAVMNGSSPTPTAASAPQGASGALGQASVGSVTPAQTGLGASTGDSGPKNTAGTPAPPRTAEDYAKYGIHQARDGSYFRWSTPEEIETQKQTIAQHEAAAARELQHQNLTSWLARPENKNLDAFTKQALSAEVELGHSLPEESQQQVLANLTKKMEGETPGSPEWNADKEILTAHLTHGQNAPPSKLAVRPDGSVYQVQPGVTMGPQDKIVGETGQDKQPTPQINYVRQPDGSYKTVVTRGAGEILPSSTVSQSGMSSFNNPTAQQRNMGEMAASVIPQAQRTVDEINAMRDKLGSAMGRANGFLINKIGKNDPDFSGLDTDLDLLSSAIVRTHFGARGGQAYQAALKKQFSEAQSPDDLISRIQHADSWLRGYAEAGGAKIPPGKPITPIVTGNVDKNTALTPPPQLPMAAVKGQKIDKATAQKFIDAFKDKNAARQAILNNNWTIPDKF